MRFASMADITASLGQAVMRFRPVLFRFPAEIEDQVVLKFGDRGACKPFEFAVYWQETSQLLRYTPGAIVQMSFVAVWPFGRIVGATKFKGGLFGEKPLAYSCQACGHALRIPAWQRKGMTGEPECPACKQVVMRALPVAPNTPPDDVRAELEAIAAAGEHTKHLVELPRVFMVTGQKCGLEWEIRSSRVREARAGFLAKGYDIVPWAQGRLAGERPIGAALVLPEKCSGWASDDDLNGVGISDPEHGLTVRLLPRGG